METTRTWTTLSSLFSLQSPRAWLRSLNRPNHMKLSRRRKNKRSRVTRKMKRMQESKSLMKLKKKRSQRRKK